MLGVYNLPKKTRKNRKISRAPRSARCAALGFVQESEGVFKRNFFDDIQFYARKCQMSARQALLHEDVKEKPNPKVTAELKEVIEMSQQTIAAAETALMEATKMVRPSILTKKRKPTCPLVDDEAKETDQTEEQ